MGRLLDENDVYALFAPNGTARLHVADIDALPRVDVVEVVHGYNTGRCRLFHCSMCGYGVIDIFQEDEHNYPVGEFNYCPNCGAKMDLEG